MPQNVSKVRLQGRASFIPGEGFFFSKFGGLTQNLVWRRQSSYKFDILCRQLLSIQCLPHLCVQDEGCIGLVYRVCSEEGGWDCWMGGVDVGYCRGLRMWSGLRAGLSSVGIEMGGIRMDHDMKDK
jgi:hypothetical protein